MLGIDDHRGHRKRHGELCDLSINLFITVPMVRFDLRLANAINTLAPPLILTPSLFYDLPSFVRLFSVLVVLIIDYLCFFSQLEVSLPVSLPF